MPSLLKFLSGVPDFFLPRSCLLCGDSLPFGDGRAACEPCMDSIERTHPPWCPTCGKPFRSGAALTHSPDHLCAECREWPPA